MRWYHYVVWHALWAALVVSAAAAWVGWHRPERVRTVVSREVQQLQVGAPPVVASAAVPGTTIRLPSVTIVAPTPTQRVVSTPPAVVTSEQAIQAERRAPTTIRVPLLWDCVKPTPTCGEPVDPYLELAQTSTGGYAVLQRPSDSLRTGSTVTTINGVASSRTSRYELSLNAGTSAMGSSSVEAEFRWHPWSDWRQPMYVAGRYERYLSSVVVNGRSVDQNFSVRVGVSFSW